MAEAGNPTLNLIALFIAAVGTLFMLISALGILRLPDVFTRMHAAGKAATLGVSCILLATALSLQDQAVMLRMIALIVLFFVTAPIATTSMARAAYRTTTTRDFRLRYDELGDHLSHQSEVVTQAAETHEADTHAPETSSEE